MKVVINKKHGGFGLSEAAHHKYIEYGGFSPTTTRSKAFNSWETGRNDFHFRCDPALVRVVEELGVEANSRFSSLKVVEIPDDVKAEIWDEDGMESVHEVHRSWS